MFKNRAVKRAPQPAEDPRYAGAEDWFEDEALADLAAFMGSQGAHANDPRNIRGPVDDFAEEVAARSLTPVDLHSGRPATPPTNDGYDQWDDEALDRLAEELSDFDDFDPNAVGAGVLPPHPADEIAASPHPARNRRPLVAAAVFAAILGTGVIGWSLLGDVSAQREPLLVRAPAGPFKIVPEQGEASVDTVESGIVFDTATGLPPKGEERLLARPEEVPELPGVTPQVSRVILPDGSEVAPEPISPVDLGPRRVRTVLVKPDGTIIEAPGTQLPTLRTAAESPLLAPTLATDVPELPVETTPGIELASLQLPTTPGGTADDISSSSGLPPIPVDNQMLAEPASVGPTASLPEGMPAGDDAVSLLTSDAVPAVPPAPVRTPPVRPQRIATATTSNTGPLDLAAAAVAPAPQQAAAVQIAPAAAPVVAATPAPAAEPVVAAVPAPAGSVFVQLASQRSEDAALTTFQSLQRRHSSLLGGLSADIQRADLGAKGVYYRVRVAQPSRETAVGLCENLKAAGGDCLIARN